ncbi:MAG: dihydrodipicolinate synthase family protein [Deltaproteobacteria bacterium]|nr:dihydrodipicolinate synthase family protein [Deltaproteobacteria bacterium]
MTATPERIRGVLSAIVTPFTSDGRLDEAGLRALVRANLEGGVHGLMCTGGTGEFPHLLREERRDVVRIVAEEACGRALVVAGTAACSTRETLLLTRDAQETGADAAIVVAPYYFRLPEASLVEHYRILAAEAPLPTVVYNNPLYTGNNLTPRAIATIAQWPRIIGLKQSNPDLGELVECIRLCGSRIAITTGIDSQFYPALTVGATGIFSTAACVMPRRLVEVYDLFTKGAHDEAAALHLKLQALNCFLEYDPGYVAPCKEALMMLGLPGGPVRAPLPALSEAERARLRAALVAVGLLRA